MRNIFGVSLALVGASVAAGGQQSTQLTIHWEKTTLVSQTTPTLQVVVNPQLRHGEPLSIAAYKAVKDLGADYVRYVPWLPYPRLAVAELEAPTAQKTSWEFSAIDPMTKEPNWEPKEEDVLMAVDQTEPGIIDVHSGSDQTSSEGTAYSSW